MAEIKHFADLGWEKRKIKTLAELRQEIKKIADFHSPHLCDDNADVYETLDLINSFETGLRGRLKHVERCLKEAVKQGDTLNDHAWSAIVFELRAILGEGEG